MQLRLIYSTLAFSITAFGLINHTKPCIRLCSPFNLACNSKHQKSETIDSLLIQTGGWGTFQKQLAIKLGCTNAIIGADMLLPAFLIPGLLQQWPLAAVQQQLIGSAWFAGAMIGFFLTGALGDRYGRKPLLIWCALARSISTLLLGVVPSFPFILLSRFLSSISAAGAFNSLLPLFFEFAPPINRAGCKRYMGIMWNLGVFWLSSSAWLLRKHHWRYLSLIFLPSLPLTWWLFQDLSESPKYLVSAGKRQEAQQVLRRIASTNGVALDESVLDRLVTVPPAPALPTASNPLKRLLENYTALFTPALVKNTLVLALLNFVLTLSYYGLTFSGDLRMEASGSLYTRQMAAALFEIPGLLAVTPLADKLGRKASSVSLLLLFAVSLSALQCLPTSLVQWRLAAYLAARLTGQASATLKWIVNAEAYPTSCRNAGLALAALAGQLGGLAVPIVATRSSTPLLVFAQLLAITSAVRSNF